MLKKLPSLLQKLPLQLQKLKTLLLKLNPKQTQPNNNDLADFSGTESSSFAVDSYVLPSETKIYKIISVVISVIFICLFFYNLVLNSQLKSLKDALDKKVALSETTSSLEKDYLAVAKSLSVYKSVKGTKTSIYPKTQLLYTDLPEGVSLDKLKISETSFELTMSGGNALLFSKFLSTVSSNPLVSTVILDSASLNSGIDEYIVSIRGMFK